MSCADAIIGTEHRRRVLLVCLMVLAACSRNEQRRQPQDQTLPPVVATAAAEPTETTTAQTITFRLTVEHRRDASVQIPEIGSRIAGLRIVDFGEEGPKEVDARVRFVKWFSLRADIAGSYIIPPMTVAWTVPDNDTRHEIRTPQIFIKVSSPPAGAAEAGQKDILDIKPPLDVARNLLPWMLGGGAAVLAAALAGMLLLLRQRRRRHAEVKRPAHEIALEELERLDQERLIERGGVREYYFRLSDIFRHYLEDRFSVPAVEQTTQELLPKIMSMAEVNPKVKSSIREVLTHADMVKFARQQPADTVIADNRQQVLTVIHETKLDNADGLQPADSGVSPQAGSRRVGGA